MSERKLKILVVDDDPAMLEVLELRLSKWGFDVRCAASAEEAQRIAQEYDPDAVLSDVVMPRMSGLDLLRALKTSNPSTVLILMTAQGSIDLAVEAMKEGARDFITKPLDHTKLESVLRSVERDVAQKLQWRRISGQLERGARFAGFIGNSKPMREVYDLIQNLSPVDASVLISGESGTGKELVARTIHDRSRRADGPFVAINAAAIPENLMESEIFGHEKGAFTGAAGLRAGCFELANRGTLFLDEIAEMPVALQPKMLRVLEDGRVRRLGGSQEFSVDVRVLAATNQDPQKSVQEGRFRQDLFYRLNTFTIELPPLRDRKSDILLLCQHFIREFNRKHKTNVEALREETQEFLKNYPWPGNVRELRNVMERAVILAKGEWLEPGHLPPYIQNNPGHLPDTIVLPLGVTHAEAEKAIILRTLSQAGNNKAEAARLLGLDVKTIRNKLKSYGVSN